MSANAHPAFAGILRAIVVAPAIIERVTYEAALRKADWSHERCDDHSVYERGREELKRLREQQKRIDPDWKIWNSICHPSCVNGRSYS